MQVSIETTDGLERKMTVGIPAAEFDGEVEKRLLEAAKTIRLNGFRKGKVPLKVVKQRFGASVRQEVAGEMINKTFYEAASENEVKPAGQPEIEPKEGKEGQDFEYVATFEVYPEVSLAKADGFSIEKLTAEVGDADVDNMIDILRKQQAKWVVVERAAKDGDQINIDFAGTKDGEAFEGGSAEKSDLVLGSGRMIPGFESGLEGLSAGDQKTLELTFPEDYHSEELKGQAVEFAVTVNSVSEQELPELSPELFKSFGIETDNEDEFRVEVKANMERELKNAHKNHIKSQVLDQLIEANTVELPNALIASEIQALRSQMAQQFGQQAENLDLKSLLPDDMFKEQAERRVTLGLLVGEVIKLQDLKADGDKVREMIDEIASTYQEPEEVVTYYYSNQQMLASIESVVLEDQVVDHLVSVSDVTETESTYEDVIKAGQANNNAG
jgi:trigger factor